MTDRDIGRMTPHCLKVELERIDIFKIDNAIEGFLMSGGKPSGLKGGMKKRYMELYGKRRSSAQGAAMTKEESDAIEAEHLAIMNGAKVDDIMRGARH